MSTASVGAVVLTVYPGHDAWPETYTGFPFVWLVSYTGCVMPPEDVKTRSVSVPSDHVPSGAYNVEYWDWSQGAVPAPEKAGKEPSGSQSRATGKKASQGQHKSPEDSGAGVGTGSKPAQDKKEKVPAVQQQNPLRVKGKSLVTELTDDQKKALNKHFKVPTTPRPEADVLKAMDKASRKQLLDSYILPRWAVRSVLNNPQNLSRVLKGEVSKETFGSDKRDFGPSAQAEWTDLKSKHPDVALLQRPHTSAEKQLKQSWTALKKKWGKDAPGLPRPKQDRSQSRPDSSRGRGGPGASSGRSESSGPLGRLSLVDGIQLFGAIAKAFR